MNKAVSIIKRDPAITFDDLAYELRELYDCLNCETYPEATDIAAARFIASALLQKLKQTPHSRLEA